MPYTNLRPCSYPGCHKLVTRGRCDEHHGAVLAAGDERLWQARNRSHLMRSPFCENCLRANNIHNEATEVRHIHPHGGDMQKILSAPIQSLCLDCFVSAARVEYAK